MAGTQYRRQCKEKHAFDGIAQHPAAIAVQHPRNGKATFNFFQVVLPDHTAGVISKGVDNAGDPLFCRYLLHRKG